MARINQPSLVVPDYAHDHVFAQDMGLATPRTIGLRTQDVSHDKQRGGKPPTLAGSWADATAGQNLAKLMHAQGLVIDESEFGTPETDPLAYEDFFTWSGLTAVVASSADTVNYVEIVTVDMTIVIGTWRIWQLWEASFTNSAGSINNLRVFDGIGGVLSYAAGSPTTTTTRERYPLFCARDYPPGVYQWIFQYRPSTTGTATARAPWVQFLWERTL